MTPQRDQFIAADAKALLDNKLFRDAFSAVSDYLEAKALTCDPDNKDMAQRVILSKQVLAAVKREIQRHIENGVVADVRIAELERKSIKSFFRR
jgi:hypothetical protein